MHTATTTVGAGHLATRISAFDTWPRPLFSLCKLSKSAHEFCAFSPSPTTRDGSDLVGLIRCLDQHAFRRSSIVHQSYLLCQAKVDFRNMTGSILESARNSIKSGLNTCTSTPKTIGYMTLLGMCNVKVTYISVRRFSVGRWLRSFGLGCMYPAA